MKIGSQIKNDLARAYSIAYSMQAEPYLKRINATKLKKFEQVRKNFTVLLNQLPEPNSKFIEKLWREQNRQMNEDFKDGLPTDFLREKHARDYMASPAPGTQEGIGKLNMIKGFPKNRLKELLIEDFVGRPLIFNNRFKTTFNNIQLLLHLCCYENAMSTKIEDFNNVIEWGGGYGRMAAIIKRFKSGITYTIIDLPSMSVIQYLYLSSIIENVKLVTKNSPSIKNGAVNLLPLSLIEYAPSKCDLFISTFALTESSPLAVDYAAGTQLFGANHVLISYQECEPNSNLPYATKASKKLAQFGKIIKSPFKTDTYYYIFK